MCIRDRAARASRPDDASRHRADARPARRGRRTEQSEPFALIDHRVDKVAGEPESGRDVLGRAADACLGEHRAERAHQSLPIWKTRTAAIQAITSWATIEPIAQRRPNICLLYTSPSPRDRTRS